MKLSPCPKCGHAPKSRPNHIGFWQVNCDNVNCRYPFEAQHHFALIAEARWNRWVKEHAAEKTK